MLVQAATGVDVVQGRVDAVFDEGTPEWIADGGFFGRPHRSYQVERPSIEEMQELKCACTGNVLVRAAPVLEGKLRFDPAFAFSGGEENVFFLALSKQGARIVYTNKSVVYEHVPPARANFRYILTERFRIAHVNAMIDAMTGVETGQAGVSRVVDGVRDIGLGFRRLMKTLVSMQWRTDRFAVAAFRAAFGAGKIAAAVGLRYQHYR